MKTLEPVFAIGLVGIVPEDPTPDNMSDVFYRLVRCPQCGGKGFRKCVVFENCNGEHEERTTSCDYCSGQPMAFWLDGLEYYEEHAHTSTDTMLALRDDKIRERVREGQSLEEVWRHGVDNYGFHLWRGRTMFEPPRPYGLKRITEPILAKR